MENSGERATHPPNPKRHRSTGTSQQTSPEGSSKPSPKPARTDPPELPVVLTEDEVRLNKFLRQRNISKRDFGLAPKIGETAKKIIGDRTRIFETLKFSPEPDARKFLEFVWGLGVENQEKLPIEALCLAADVHPLKLIGALLVGARDTSRMESALKTMIAHPEVVDRTIQAATEREPIVMNGNIIGHTHGSVKDRELVHKAVGWLPSPKGSSINVNLFGDQGHRLQEPAEDDGEESLMDSVFGHDAREIENWGEDRRRLLEAPK